MSTTERYPVKGWTVIAVPEYDGSTTSTRTYTMRNLEARDGQGAIAAALEPSATQVRAMLKAMGLDESHYDWMRGTLLRIFNTADLAILKNGHQCQDPAYGPCPRPECGQPWQ